jgi:hypothetical protein
MSQKSRAVETHRYTYNYRPGPLPSDGLVARHDSLNILRPLVLAGKYIIYIDALDEGKDDTQHRRL